MDVSRGHLFGGVGVDAKRRKKSEGGERRRRAAAAGDSEEPQGSSDYSNPTPVIPPDLRTKNRHPVEKLTRLTGCTKPDKLVNYARVYVMVGFNWIFLIQSARYAS